MYRKQLNFLRRMRFAVLICSVCLGALRLTGSAQTLKGTVTDVTTQKPAAGDEVVLIDFSNGLQELGHTRSDSDGSFSFNVPESKRPRILQVIHQGAPYYKTASVGSSSIRLEVYDVSKKLKDIVVTADVTRFQVKEGSLQAVRLFAVRNNSSPPRTQMSDHNFEFYLPEGAQIDHCMARSAGGQPVRTFPLPQHEKNRYAFIFPLRPGETQFQMLFHMPYTGEATINPRPVYGVEHFVVMLPKQMQFATRSGAAFKTMIDPRQSDAILQVASNTTVGQALAFTLSGTGALADSKNESAEGLKPPNTPQSGNTVRGPATRVAIVPPAVPNTSGKSQWYVLGGLGILLAAGTISIAQRSTKRKAPPVRTQLQDDPAAYQTTSNSAPGGTPTLNDLKEQLFRLEVDHKQKRIPQPEYENALAGLHQNLQRAIATRNADVQLGNAK